MTKRMILTSPWCTLPDSNIFGTETITKFIFKRRTRLFRLLGKAYASNYIYIYINIYVLPFVLMQTYHVTYLHFIFLIVMNISIDETHLQTGTDVLTDFTNYQYLERPWIKSPQHPWDTYTRGSKNSRPMWWPWMSISKWEMPLCSDKLFY